MFVCVQRDLTRVLISFCISNLIKDLFSFSPIDIEYFYEIREMSKRRKMMVIE